MNFPNDPISGVEKFEGNQLFPVFLKLNQLHVLLVGAGNVGLEKLNALVGNCPEATITIVAKDVSTEVIELASNFSKVSVNIREFDIADLDNKDLIVVATNNPNLNTQIRDLTRSRNLLANFADKPDLCDFYLGSIVKKGDLKIGISTNGKSPTIAKRLKEVLQSSLPDELNDSLQQLNRLRNSLQGDFTYKVKELNKATSILVTPGTQEEKVKKLGWLKWPFKMFR